MDKIWYRKSFEVGGHWPLCRGWKNEWPRRTDYVQIYLTMITKVYKGLFTLAWQLWEH